MRVKILVVTHSGLGNELYNTTMDIMGKGEGVEVCGISRRVSLEDIRVKIGGLLKGLLKDGAVLILTDMLGGTPTNIALPYLKDDNVEIITGINLPMLLTALNKRNNVEDVKALADIVHEAGMNSMINCRAHIDR